MKKLYVSIFFLLFLFATPAKAQFACVQCSVNEQFCWQCELILAPSHLNCWATCNYCNAWSSCSGTRPVNKLGATKAHSFSKEKQYYLPVSHVKKGPSPQNIFQPIKFDRKHILQLAETDLVLAYITALIEESPHPVGEVVTTKWTPVDITRADLENLLEGNQQWRQQITERSKEVAKRGFTPAVFQSKLERVNDKFLRYSIWTVEAPANQSGKNYATFDLMSDGLSGNYISTKVFLQ